MSKSFRKIIQAEVKRQQLSGYAIGRAADMSVRTVQAYLAEQCDLGGERLSKIADVLGLELRLKQRKRR
jgi:lambda repressor-like predicted transcriptional regulator